MSAERVLVLGGTHFIGRAFVERLLVGGAPSGLTLFNRGMKNPDLFPEVRRIKGDRETSDIDQILMQDWDVIVDINGYFPNSIESLLRKLKGKVGRYVYVSTVSVYDTDYYLGKDLGLVTEDFALLACTAEQRVGSAFEHYGAKKAECERIIRANEWLDSISLRPSIVYGKYDWTERYYYWLQRIKKRERIVIPNEGSERANLTFVNDLAHMLQYAVDMPKHRASYNVVTHEVNTLLDKVTSISRVMDRHPEFVSIPTSVLDAVENEAHRGFECTAGADMLIYDTTNVKRDFAFDFTPYDDSIRRAIEYYDTATDWAPGKRGLTYEEEDTLLESYS